MHNAVKDISSPDGPVPAAMGSIKILIAAGGTGGHIYPAIAIADAIREQNPDVEIKFVGTRNHMEWNAVPRAGYDITGIWISGFHRRLTLKNLLFPLKLITSLFQSLNIVSSFKPDIVISCGGYAAGPVGWIAAKKGVPLVIQEQNSFPGVTNRLLGKNATRIFTAFKDAEAYFPDGKTRLAGNPTRKSLVNADRNQACKTFGFQPEKQTLLVLGGSGGAKKINEAMAGHIERLHDEFNLQIIWQCGHRYFDELKTRIHGRKFDNLMLTDFLHNMPEAYAVADLVISRAGALSCSELALTGNASILVPSPNVAGDHQTKNARSMFEMGAAELLRDEDIQEQLSEVVKKIIFDKTKLEKMEAAAKKLAKPDAASEIAKEIIQLAKTNRN